MGAVGCIWIGTRNRRSIHISSALRSDKYNELSLLSTGLVGIWNFWSIPIFSAMRSDNYNRLSLLSTGLVGTWHFRSIPVSLMIKYFRNRVYFVLSNTVERQVGYILFVFVLPSEMYGAGSSPTWIECPPIPQKTVSPFLTLYHKQ